MLSSMNKYDTEPQVEKGPALQARLASSSANQTINRIDPTSYSYTAEYPTQTQVQSEDEKLMEAMFNAIHKAGLTSSDIRTDLEFFKRGFQAYNILLDQKNVRKHQELQEQQFQQIQEQQLQQLQEQQSHQLQEQQYQQAVQYYMENRHQIPIFESNARDKGRAVLDPGSEMLEKWFNRQMTHINLRVQSVHNKCDVFPQESQNKFMESFLQWYASNESKTQLVLNHLDTQKRSLYCLIVQAGKNETGYKRNVR